MIISMMVKCNAIVVIEHDERSDLSDAPVVIEHDNNRDHRDIASRSSKQTAWPIQAGSYSRR